MTEPCKGCDERRAKLMLLVQKITGGKELPNRCSACGSASVYYSAPDFTHMHMHCRDCAHVQELG